MRRWVLGGYLTVTRRLHGGDASQVSRSTGTHVQIYFAEDDTTYWFSKQRARIWLAEAAIGGGGGAAAKPQSSSGGGGGGRGGGGSGGGGGSQKAPASAADASASLHDTVDSF